MLFVVLGKFLLKCIYILLVTILKSHITLQSNYLQSNLLIALLFSYFQQNAQEKYCQTWKDRLRHDWPYPSVYCLI